jgi:hypothetical protein
MAGSHADAKINFDRRTSDKKVRPAHSLAVVITTRRGPATLCILYDSRNAFQAISRDVPPAEHAAAAATGQGLRRWLETDGVTVNFIWTKGHLADPGKLHKRTRRMVCAQANKLADDHATAGQRPAPEGGYQQYKLKERER